MSTMCGKSLTIFVIFFTVVVFADSFQGINYIIIEKSTFGSAKISIDVKLDKRVSKEYLQDFALYLQNNEPIKYDRMFISYYLPGMIKSKGAWATTHFNPDLKVEILGISIEEEEALQKKSNSNQDKIIGEWLYEAPYVGAKYTFIKRNDKIVMIIKYKDGSGSEKEMIQKKQSGKVRFEEKKPNVYGEYYMIEKSGNMGVYDNDGLIQIMRKIK